MANLDTIADRQAQWSQSANKLKSVVDTARWAVFILSVSGALLAALASQMTTESNVALFSSPRTWVAILGAACLAAATFFTQRLLGADRVSAWVRARAISEALKREAYKCAANAAPYDAAPDPGILLENTRQDIEKAGNDLVAQLIDPVGKGGAPRAALAQKDYIDQRVRGQIAWYRQRAGKYRTTATWLRRIEFVLALAATLITAVASVTPKSAPLFGIQLDIAALTAVLTTVAGAVLAHVEASRFDYLVTTYLAAARQLEDRLALPPGSWSDFVNDCENILKNENASWIVKWTK